MISINFNITSPLKAAHSSCLSLLSYITTTESFMLLNVVLCFYMPCGAFIVFIVSTHDTVKHFGRLLAVLNVLFK